MLKNYWKWKQKVLWALGRNRPQNLHRQNGRKWGKKQGVSKPFLRSALRKNLDTPQDLEIPRPEYWRGFAVFRRRKALKTLTFFAVSIRYYLPSKSGSWVLADRSWKRNATLKAVLRKTLYFQWLPGIIEKRFRETSLLKFSPFSTALFSKTNRLKRHGGLPKRS